VARKDQTSGAKPRCDPDDLARPIDLPRAFSEIHARFSTPYRNPNLASPSWAGWPAWTPLVVWLAIGLAIHYVYREIRSRLRRAR
jgi:hypothetical protein